MFAGSGARLTLQRCCAGGRAAMASTGLTLGMRMLLTMVGMLGVMAGCGDDGTTAPGRRYRMGFSAFPPSPDLVRALEALDLWMDRADAAIIHESPPWTALLAGQPAESLVHAQFDEVVGRYRSRGLRVVYTIDVTNPVDRTTEAEALTAAGRSITEPAVQQLYRAWAVAVARVVQPEYLGLAAETNLIRIAAARPVYDAVVSMTNAAAGDVLAARPSQRLYVSAQVETAWGRLQGSNQYVGIATDLQDFPFMTALGLSSYPYLGGFSEPSELPGDWYRRLGERPGQAPLPLLVTEGGWTSANVGTLAASPEKQARWIRRQAALLDAADATYVFQLQFTDIDLKAFGHEDDPRLVPFARTGLVDTALAAKPALAVWDSVFALPRQ
jgi:hypothetical protein